MILKAKQLIIETSRIIFNGGYNGDESCDYLYSLSKFNHTLDNACNCLLFYREGSGSPGGICWGDEEVQVEASSNRDGLVIFMVENLMEGWKGKK